MKKKINICLLVFLITINVLDAQTFIVEASVLDKETNEGLPFANIMVLGYPIGTTSNENGVFKLVLDDSLYNGFLIISYIGYESCKISIKECEKSIISLIPQTYALDEVTVKPTNKKHKEITLNKFQENKCMLRYSISTFDSIGATNVPYRPTEPTIEACYFPFSEEYAFCKIREAVIYSKNLNDSISYFRLRIFNADEEKRPLNDLLTEALIVEVPSGKQIININLNDYNLYIPSNGLFIGFELLIIPENKKTIRNELEIEADIYSPFLYQRYSKEYGDYWTYTKGEWKQSLYWYFRQGIWIESKNSNIADKKTAGPYMFKPAISLVLLND
jgi:hypothetical protein